MKSIKGKVSVGTVLDNGACELVKMHANSRDNTFSIKSSLSPHLTIEISVDAPEAKKFFVPGKQYHVEFKPVETGEAGI